MWEGIVRLVCNSNLSTVIRCWWDHSWSNRTILGDFHTKGPWMSQQCLASEQKQEWSMCMISNYSFSYFSSLVLDFQDLFLRLRHTLFSESSKEICMNHDPFEVFGQIFRKCLRVCILQSKVNNLSLFLICLNPNRCQKWTGSQTLQFYEYQGLTAHQHAWDYWL